MMTTSRRSALKGLLAAPAAVGVAAGASGAGARQYLSTNAPLPPPGGAPPGPDYVAPDDIAAILPQTAAHRLVPVSDAGRGAVEQVRAMLDAVPLP